MTAAVELRDVRKSFGKTEIIRGANLAVRPGERVAIIGPNGAGKSTLFNLISGRLSPTRGEGSILGHDSRALPPAAAEAEKAYAYMRNHKYFKMWQREGLMMVMEYASAAGILPTHNFKDGTFPRVDRINGETMLGGYKIGDSACFACSTRRSPTKAAASRPIHTPG